VRAFRHSNFAGLTVTYDPRSRGLLPSGVTITIEFPPFHSPARARHRHELQHDAEQTVPCCPRQVSVFFSGIPPRADHSFLFWFVLALSGGTSFPGPPLLRTGSIRVLLERNPPKASPRPGWRLRFWGERAIPLLVKKGTICHQNTPNRPERERTPLPPPTCR
jgi:hypothetical protein